MFFVFDLPCVGGRCWFISNLLVCSSAGSDRSSLVRIDRYIKVFKAGGFADHRKNEENVLFIAKVDSPRLG